MPPTEVKMIRRPHLEKAVELLWWIIVGSGIGIRLAVCLYKRSLWLDEAMLAVNVLDQSFSQLPHRLEYAVVRPPLLLVFGTFGYALWG